MTPAMREIIEGVATKHGMTVERLLTKSSSRKLCRPRQEAAYRLRKAVRWSWPQIGQALKQHHTTSIHGARAYEARVQSQEHHYAR